MSLKLKKNGKKSKANVIGGCCIAIFGNIGALWLLIGREVISGAEFVVLSLGFSVIGLIIFFATEIQEFSIAGNGVKFKELRSEAEKTIEELKEARTELFRVLIKKSIAFSGGFASGSKVDERVEQFIQLFEKIEKFDCIECLFDDITRSLNILMVSQFNALKIIHNETKNIGYFFTDAQKPDYLYIRLEDTMIHDLIQNKKPTPQFNDIKADVINGIKAYSQLYSIMIKLNKLEKSNA